MTTSRAAEREGAVPSEHLEAIAKLAAAICGTPTARVSLVETALDRVPAAQFESDGLHENALSAWASAEADDLFVVADLRSDARCAALPAAAGRPEIRFYASARIVSLAGVTLGAISVSDCVPHALGPAKRAALRFLASQVLRLLEQRHTSAELERTKLELRMLEAAVTNANDAVVVTEAGPLHEPGPRIVYANAAFTKETGYTLQEVIGQSPRFLQGAKTDRTTTRTIRQALEGWQPVEAELLNYRKDGTEFWVQISISPVSLQGNGWTHWVSVQRDITERKQSEERLLRLHALELAHDALQFAATHDDLTRLANRAYLIEALDAKVHAARSDLRSGCAVLFLDLDRFKRINDRLGHRAGDALLVQVARRLEASVRTEDFVARISGDEFVVLLEGLKDETLAREMAERIAAALALPFTLEAGEVVVAVSIGIVLVGARSGSADDVMRDADIAMYRAKDSGRDRIEMFEPALRERAVALAVLESDIRTAWDRHEFFLAYQPLVHLKTGRLAGFEALIRWQHPTRGELLPQDFFGTVEEMGLVVPLGESLLADACRQLRAWRDKQREPALTMSVNLSPRQLNSRRLVPFLCDLLDEAGVPPAALNLELTETTIIDDFTSATKVLERLRAFGVGIHMDDFGTGFSSLSYLRRIAFDGLKIDRSFVAGENGTLGDPEIVDATIVLAHKLGLKVIAEGVETEFQRQALLHLNCDYAQGYLFAAPHDAATGSALVAAAAGGGILFPRAALPGALRLRDATA